MKIALLGTGRLGSGMAERWLRGGDQVHVWNRTAQKARALEPLGAKVFDDPVAAIQGVDIVHIILSDDAAVDAMLDRILEKLPKGMLVVDHTTTSPAGAAARAKRCDGKGVEFLHAPVFMSPAAVREGQGLMLVSGPAARVQKAEAHLRKMTGELWNVGEAPERAGAFKLFGNAMIVTMTAGLADIFMLAKTVDVAAPQALELFSHFNALNTINIRGKNMANGNFAPSFELTMARKDVRLMLEMADRGHAEVNVLPYIAARMDELIDEGYGDRDVGVLAASLDSAALRSG